MKKLKEFLEKIKKKKENKELTEFFRKGNYK